MQRAHLTKKLEANCPCIPLLLLSSAFQIPKRNRHLSSHHVDDVERVADDVGILVGGRFAARGTVEELRNRFKRIRIVVPDGKLPVRIPAPVILQKLSRREWTGTVDGYCEELLDELRFENDAVDRPSFSPASHRLCVSK